MAFAEVVFYQLRPTLRDSKIRANPRLDFELGSHAISGDSMLHQRPQQMLARPLIEELLPILGAICVTGYG
jgi:hypothetical protein